MCPTPTGRIHTRVATVTLPALLGLIVSLITGNADWIVLIGIYLLMGVALDTLVYPWLLRYQPPWMTGILAIGEFALLYAIGSLVELELTLAGALALYWASWLLIVFTRIVLLPIFSLTYLESAGEFRRVQWSIPASQAIVPIVADPTPAAPGPLIREASGVRARPLDLKPSPSGVHPSPRRESSREPS